MYYISGITPDKVTKKICLNNRLDVGILEYIKIKGNATWHFPFSSLVKEL